MKTYQLKKTLLMINQYTTLESKQKHQKIFFTLINAPSRNVALELCFLKNKIFNSMISDENSLSLSRRTSVKTFLN